MIKVEIQQYVPAKTNEEYWEHIFHNRVSLSISNYGSVRRFKNGEWIDLQSHFSSGYFAVSIANKNVKVHRLVAKAFVPNPEKKPFINHKDGNKQNNYFKNLEWVTNKENSIHFAVLKKMILENDTDETVRLDAKTAVKIMNERKGISENDLKEVPGFDGSYFISRSGRVYRRLIKLIRMKDGPVRREKMKELKPFLIGRQPTVCLSVNGRSRNVSIRKLKSELYGRN